MNNTTDDQVNGTFLSETDKTALLETLRQFTLEEQFGEYYHLIFVFTFIVCVIGCITNILNVVVFSKSNLNNSMNMLLLVLSVSDIIFICIELPHPIHYFEGFHMYPFYSWVVFSMTLLFLETSFLTVTNWIVAVVGFCRFVVITWPHRCAKWFTLTKVKIILITIYSLSIILALPIFAMFTYQHLSYKGLELYDLEFSTFAKANNRLALRVFWVFLLLRDFVPMLITLVSTCGLVWILFKRKANQQNNQEETTSKINSYKTTAMITILLVLYWLSNFPDAFLLFVAVCTGGNSELHGRFKKATDIIRIFSLANNSLSFFIYYGLGVEFRSTFKRVFCARTNTESPRSESQTSEVVIVEDPECGTKEQMGMKTSTM